MMVKPLHCCVFLPVTLLAAFCTDTSSKFVCIGDSVLVFQDITSTSFQDNTSTSFNNDIIILKTFGIKSEAIMKFSMQNVSNKYSIPPKFKDKVSFENGSILIHNFQTSDEASYSMLYNESPKRKNVDICVLAPPTKRCKPRIIEDENVLTVSLDDHNFCGKPVVSVHWIEYPNNSNVDETIIILPPGTKSGKYRACIDGEALKCVKNSTERDNCVNYTTQSMRGNNDQATSSDIPQRKTSDFTTVVIVPTVLISLVLGCVILIIIILRRQFGNFFKLKTETERRLLALPMVNQPLVGEVCSSDGEESNNETEEETHV
ncbi:hypothetical protein CHS0354_025606 [Potamilus streckersoni]|uniref:Ig-like domain-containing protein n=1 Tax=Potamilus streckersoni TaxID=2493646 RepID=A0AAE0S1P7_9BIVA|nr:hypothetical protein CHS0354_025606 [Potamilus streckersoni]